MPRAVEPAARRRRCFRSGRRGRDTFLFSFLLRAGIQKVKLAEFLLFRAKSKTCKGKSLANRIPHVPGTRGTGRCGGAGGRWARPPAPRLPACLASPRHTLKGHGAFCLSRRIPPPAPVRRGIPLLPHPALTPKASPSIISLRRAEQRERQSRAVLPARSPTPKAPTALF